MVAEKVIDEMALSSCGPRGVTARCYASIDGAPTIDDLTWYNGSAPERGGSNVPQVHRLAAGGLRAGVRTAGVADRQDWGDQQLYRLCRPGGRRSPKRH